MALTITSANAVVIITVPQVFPNGVQLQKFGVDDAFTVDVVDATETQVGVDGYGVAGYVPRSPRMTIRLLASADVDYTVFETWIAQQDLIGDVIYASMTIALPSVNRKYTCYQGSLRGISTMPDARRVLANREFHIQWLPQGTIPEITSGPL